jgi:hypothetical protein
VSAIPAWNGDIDAGGVCSRMYKFAFYPVEMAMWEFA